MTKTSYCKFCGAAAGESHEPWCPSNSDITHSQRVSAPE